MDYLGKYGYTPDPESMARAIELIAANLDMIASEQVYKDCFSMMDLTTLKTDDTPASVAKLVGKDENGEKKIERIFEPKYPYEYMREDELLDEARYNAAIDKFFFGK